MTYTLWNMNKLINMKCTTFHVFIYFNFLINSLFLYFYIFLYSYIILFYLYFYFYIHKLPLLVRLKVRLSKSPLPTFQKIGTHATRIEGSNPSHFQSNLHLQIHCRLLHIGSINRQTFVVNWHHSRCLHGMRSYHNTKCHAFL